MGCTKKYAWVFALALTLLTLFGGLGACSKEELRRTLPAERSF